VRILVDCGDYRCGNMGDVAMLQVAVGRLRELWPSARIQVITWDPTRLARYCPGTEAIPGSGRVAWLADHALLGRVHHVLPAPVSRALVDAKGIVRRRWPQVLNVALRVRGAMPEDVARDLAAFRSSVANADLVVVAGAGGLTDHAVRWALPVLELLDMAIRQGTPTAMFGQGVGPLDTETLLPARMRKVLPRVDLIALREGRLSLPLVLQSGVDRHRVRVTGDDAIEPAFRVRGDTLGEAIGINIRLSFSSGLDSQIYEALRPALSSFAARRHAPLIPLPIDASDIDSIRSLLSGCMADVAGDAASLDTPEAVIRRVSACRIVVTGAYHAAVFALSQGISVVCLAKSSYFLGKFRGLAEQFGDGCTVVALDAADLGSRLGRAMNAAWERSESARPFLLSAAARQIEAGHQAYNDVAALISPKGAASSAVQAHSSDHETVFSEARR